MEAKDQTTGLRTPQRTETGDHNHKPCRDLSRDYFEWHIHFHLGEDEKRAIAKFCELLRKHQLGPVFEPNFVA